MMISRWLTILLRRFATTPQAGHVSVDKLSPEWHAMRPYFLTASNVGAAAGLSMTTSVQEAWRRAVYGDTATRSEFSEALMKRGNVCECAVLEQFRSLNSQAVLFDDVGCWQRGGLFASPDCLVWNRPASRIDDEFFTLEVKCPLSFAKWAELPPLEHLVQCQAQLYCMNLSKGFLVAASLKPVPEFRVYTVEFDADLWDRLIVPGARYHARCVRERRPPPSSTGKQLLITRANEQLARTTRLCINGPPTEEILFALASCPIPYGRKASSLADASAKFAAACASAAASTTTASA